ncbi:FAD-dependent monooxygenase [Fulvivirgaceae bacterium BMA12]|uniref:FAD-dependent monooxygenase n=1 Tax=Agaribacillus aureus TaxID=3051825 RepID=A0ABT8LKU4_9BACT|nr:FAD-dependent monooxygenase [Fulvivirgaceae bacterium BMA12]
MTYTIIGAGIGGLTTALALEKKGVDYKIFEKAPELNEVGAGIWLAPNALQVLETLGISDEIQSNGNNINRITLGKSDLTPLSDNLQDDIQRKFGHSTVAIHRATLQKILFAHIPAAKIALGKAFIGYEKPAGKKLTVKFSDGTTCETDYLIGADGIHSQVRAQLFPTSKTRYSGQTCWRGIAEYKLTDDFQHRGLELWGDQIRFGISAVDVNRVYWFAVALAKANQRDDDQSLVKDKLSTLFTGFHPIVKQLLSATKPTKIIRSDISDLHPLQNWFKDNICLIGDAAHATTPNMGQGGAQAIEDAYYLSHLIAQHPNENVFPRFQQKRQKKVNTIVRQSWTTGKMAHWKYGRWWRDLLLKNIPKSILQKKMVELYQID